jgi:transposase-like protein
MGEIMPGVLNAKPKLLSFTHPGKQKAYEFLMENPSMDFMAYQTIGGDPSLDEKSFEEVSRAIRLANEPEDGTHVGATTRINPDIFFTKKATAKKSMKMQPQGDSAMANESNTAVAPKKRGRPPGTKKATVSADKPKAKRGRPVKDGKRATPAKLSKSKKSGKGTRYTAEKQQEIVAFILSKGRGGLSQAKAKFGISYPTLARWVKVAGSGKGSSKVEKDFKLGRPKKSETAPSGHVLISKKVLKEFRKGISNLEAAFGAFSNALRVLE